MSPIREDDSRSATDKCTFPRGEMEKQISRIVLDVEMLRGKSCTKICFSHW